MSRRLVIKDGTSVTHHKHYFDCSYCCYFCCQERKNSAVMGHFRRAFTAKEKLAVIAFAEAQGNQAASCEFNIDESCIQQWGKQKSRLQAMPATKKADRGKSEQFPQRKEKVLEWVLELRCQGIAVSMVKIRLQARLIAKKLAITEFGSSADWCYAFHAAQ